MEALIRKEQEEELDRIQQEAYSKGLPVLIVFEGDCGRVIGRVVNELIRCLEPRGVEYHHFSPGRASDPRGVMGFLRHTPARSRISIYDRSWYSEIAERCGRDPSGLPGMLEAANGFEAYLHNNGTFVIKVFLRASDAALDPSSEAYWPQADECSFLCADHIDLSGGRSGIMDGIRRGTDAPHCPWRVIDAGASVRDTVGEAASYIIGRLRARLGSDPAPVPAVFERSHAGARTERGPGPGGRMEGYQEEMDRLSGEIARLQSRLSVSDRSLIVCFEGRDAAGKGSAIKHLCHALNPRGYEVMPIKAPTPEELAHTHLWRFAGTVPERGRASIYDRTWYGRMLVEPVEGLCTDAELMRAPAEINGFEKALADAGAIIVKIWMEVSKKEQLKRFKDRGEDPLKRWKLTDDDWRNRSKWGEYSERIDAVLATTDTEAAPWTVIGSDDKKRARAEVLRAVAGALERGLG
ncbi:MAG: hypothetical protein LBG62_00115 [Candidatus Methanoplasma sp.]|jgi:polyphosphate kinase 2 (PPK2 family)|nr:hypothetical protein [Candidatus Methanoplasma sp.]